MDFVNDDVQLLPFLDRIRHPNGALSHVEVLLESHNMGSSAVRSQIVAWRTREQFLEIEHLFLSIQQFELQSSSNH